MSVSTTKTDRSVVKTRRAYKPNWPAIALWLSALILLATAIFMRLYQLGLPFDRDSYDEGVYWQSLRAMSAGHILYRDIFYSQPPFFLLSTFPGYALFGNSLWSARLGIAFVSLFGLLGAFLLGKALSGRLGAVAALLLLVVNPQYLAQSQTIQAEVSSAAFSLLAVGLAYMWWEHHEGIRGLVLAALTGIALTLSIFCKLLGVAALVPIGLLLLANPWQAMRKPAGRGFAALRPVVVCTAAAVISALVLLLPFLGSYQALVQGVITFHSDAENVLRNSQQNGVSPAQHILLLQQALTSFMTLAALYGIAAAFLRRDWRVIPLIAWLLTTLYLLWLQVPLFQHHLVALTPPLLALAIMGINGPSAYSGTTGEIQSPGFFSRVTRYMTWLAIILILLTSVLDVRQDRAYYRAAEANSVNGLAQLEARVAADLRQAITPAQEVVTDAQFIAGLADRNTPPSLVDTSAVRINSGYLTLAQLEDAARQPQVHAVLFFTGRFYLPNVAAFHNWVARHFRLLHNYDGGRELWIRDSVG